MYGLCSRVLRAGNNLETTLEGRETKKIQPDMYQGHHQSMSGRPYLQVRKTRLTPAPNYYLQLNFLPPSPLLHVCFPNLEQEVELAVQSPA